MSEDHYNNPVYRTWRSLLAKKEAQGCAGLSAAERVFWCVYLLDLELFNGGFDQYFLNYSGDHANEVVAALRAIGAHRAGELADTAIRYVFPASSVPVERDERFEHMRAVERSDPEYDRILDRWSTAYCNEAEDVYPLLAEHAGRHGFLVS